MIAKIHWRNETGQYLEDAPCNREDLNYTMVVHRIEELVEGSGMDAMHQLAILIFTYSQTKSKQWNRNITLFEPHGYTLEGEGKNEKPVPHVFPSCTQFDFIRGELMVIRQQDISDFGFEVWFTFLF